ncbi:hypothetical protein [Novosphingobium sp. PC22D]|uniref:hypothetical protein n=1 Tax=Novosphingobium sp. PC22D TaxID=1962403 RepID=UPI0011452D82|nr:hypothetical protein [Novosphingobium sp. PC22D]
MYWGKGAAVLLAATTLALPHMAMAGIVVASSGPSASKYPAGTKLDDSASITLRAGDSVTILDGSGTRVLRGPGAQKVGASGMPPRTMAFNALVRPSRVRTGAVRGSGSTARNTNIWNVDATGNGRMCIVNPGAVSIWRPNGANASSYSVSALDGSGDSSVSFNSNAYVGTWRPAGAAIANGSTYRISGQGMSRDVTFVVLAEQPQTPEELASALIANKCTAQLQMLTDTMALPSS